MALSHAILIFVKPQARLLVLLFVVVIWQLHVCAAHDVAVRLVDARNGQVFASETVSLQFSVGNGVTSHQETLEAKTGIDGVARFRLPEPPPLKFTVWPNRLYICADLFCSDFGVIDTQQVIHAGCVSRCSKPGHGCRCKFGKQVSQLQPTPGEVVLLVRPVTAWERFWWRFLE
ncbi:MAG: hypothetical protein ACLQBK_07095 [Candidatus Sulfotelmatobacter sp.]